MNSVETSVANISLIDGDILRIAFKPNCYVDLPELEENMEAYKKLMKTEKVYLLTIAPEGSTLSVEARNKFTGKERAHFKIAEAFVISSLAHKIMADFITRIQKPAHKLKFFNSEKEAMAWLQELKKKRS